MSRSALPLTFDRFHSHLLDRLALREGLVEARRWHGLPSSDDEGDIERLRRRIVRENFDAFASVDPWKDNAERALLSCAEVAIHYVDKWRRRRNIWVSTNDYR